MMSDANEEQREYWMREGGHWVKEAARYDAMNREFGEAMIDAAQLRPGERVLDVGCGNGATTLEAARRVAPGGSVVGIDVSAPMLALARERAAAAGVRNVEFVHDDAQTHAFEGGTFDAVISRFGNMFFEDPEAAFSNIARAVRSGGRLAIMCWQELAKSEWILVPGAAAAPHVGLPSFGPPGAPGPFAFADGDRLRRILEGAGFRDVTLESITRPMRIGDDVDDVAEFIASIDMVRNEMFANKPPEKVEAAITAAKEALRPYAGENGVVLHGGAWLVRASR